MSQDLLFYVITTAITIAIGIITYFLKRTIDRNDKLEENVQEIREMQFTLSEKYATKAEVAEIKATMQKLNEKLYRCQSGQSVNVLVKRLGKSGYFEVSYDVNVEYR